MDQLTIGNVLFCAPILSVQLVLVGVQSLFWLLFIPWFSTSCVKPIIQRFPTREQFADLNQRMAKEGYGVVFSHDVCMENGCDTIAYCAQHLAGATLALSAVLLKFFELPGMTPAVAFALLRHGALCEVGWEVSDLLLRFYQLAFQGATGKAKNPPVLVIAMAVHHIMGLLMVVPMNIFFPNNYWYSSLVFVLQSAAAVGLGAQQYGFLLDISSSSGLKRMKFCVTVSFFGMWLGRVFAYFFIIFNLLVDIHTMSRQLFYLGCVSALFMSLINLAFAADATKKFIKYIGMVEVGKEVKRDVCEKVPSLLSRHVRDPDGSMTRRQKPQP